MTQFNSFPGNRTASVTTTSSSATVGVFPPLQSTNFPLGDETNLFDRQLSIEMEGFNGDSDYFDMPTSSTGTLNYNDSAGSLQWSKVFTDVNAAVDNWVGMMFDKTDNLLYGVGVDIGTAPDTFYLFSVNQAGTLVNIGNDQPSVDFTITTYWHANTSLGTNLRRVDDGSGNFFVNSGAQTAQEMEINFSTGAIVTDPTDYMVSAFNLCLEYKTPSGIRIGGFDAASASEDTVLFLSSGADNNTRIVAPSSVGLSQNVNTAKPVMWKGKIVPSLWTAGSAIQGPRAYKKSDFDKFVNQLKINLQGQ